MSAQTPSDPMIKGGSPTIFYDGNGKSRGVLHRNPRAPPSVPG